MSTRPGGPGGSHQRRNSAPSGPPLNTVPLPGAAAAGNRGKPPPSRPGAAASAATAPHFDNTDGLYDHYRPQSIAGQRRRTIPTPGEEADDQLEAEIGQYTAPRANGQLYSATEGMERAFPYNEVPNVTATAIDNLHELLDQWQMDPVKRELLIKSVMDASINPLDRHSALLAIHNRLKKAFDELGRQYGPEWIKAEIQRTTAVEQHPIFVFSQWVAGRTHYAATAYIKNAAQLNLIPYIKNLISDRKELITSNARHVELAKTALGIAKKAVDDFDEMRDVLLEDSFPLSGIDLDSAMEIVDAYVTYCNGLASEVKQGIATLHTQYTPMAEVLGPITGRDAPPWDMVDKVRTGATLDMKDRELRILLSADEFQNLRGQKPLKQMTNFQTYHAKLLERAGLGVQSNLGGLLKEATDVATKGTIGNLGLSEGKPTTGLSFAGEFHDYLSRLLKTTVGYANQLYLTPFFDLNGILVDANRFVATNRVPDDKSLIELRSGETYPELYILLTPYLPATLHSRLRGGRVYNFNADYFITHGDTLKSLHDYYTKLDEMLLNPISGRWKTLELQLYKNRSPATKLSPSFYLETVVAKIKSRFKDEQSVKVFKKLVDSIRTGAQYETLVNTIGEFEPFIRSEELGRIFAKKLETVHLKLKAFGNALASSGGIITKLTNEDFKFPLQYHIDARFTILYVMLRHEYIRSIIVLATEESGKIIKQNLIRAENDFATAVESSLATSTSDKNDVYTLGLVRWSLLPENSGQISFDPVVRGHIDSAWSWIMEHATAIPWDSPALEGKISANDIINDMSDSTMAAQVKNFLADVVALMFAFANAYNTTQRPNPSSAPQLGSTPKLEGSLIIKALHLRHRFDEVNSEKVILYFVVSKLRR